MRLIIVCLIIFLLQGCQSRAVKQAPTLPRIEYQVDAAKYSIPTVDAFYQLTTEQVKSITDFIEQDKLAELSPHEQVYALLESKLNNFDFRGENLYATESLDSNSGNCMALAMLTYAIAKQLDVEISFQVMHTIPMLLGVSGNISVTSDHVRSFLHEQGQDSNSFLGKTNRIRVDYFPDKFDRGGKMIGSDEFFAMFYRNLAADAIMDKQLELAYLLLNEALKYNDKYAPAINMQAVVLRQLGEFNSAEQMYLYGLEVADEKIDLLSNYHFLLVSRGRYQEAEKIKTQLLALEHHSPYKWYFQAQDAMLTEDYSSAKIYLNKFLKNTHYFHKAYFDLARVEYQLGDTLAAKKALNKALALSAEAEDSDLYQAKLTWLSASD
ncbi:MULTISPECIES: lipopolysaccharide assembly protein LapB [unclassified Shewanella]|uniref:tetratricopeptide repeat protein n=1 Tax=unclassified Shewanella TaxID=196818 RepID=UPI001BBBEE85|nr:MULTISPECIES: hypothetical protein [unclassified Shewanella]GIU07880.1 hypothetical protein TUM4444_08010 [Shewanella sp. MBTL60-112-B1]GIU30535.1 hypothetical protein TUM4445_13990 [Shewanella sp. MBTL60-112-B2]